jgi:hypothetical protein
LSQNKQKHTLIIVRRALTEPNAALAGAISTMSFARFKASMAIFNEERAPSRPFGRREFASMVETRGSCGERCGVQAVRGSV